MFRKILFLLVSVLNLRVGKICRLNTRTHFHEPQPIFLKDGTFLEPTEASGDILLNHGDVITISCEGTGPIQHRNVITETVTATITCEEGESFVNNNWLRGPTDFSEFRCSDSPSHSSFRTNRTCFDNNVIYEVGYNIEGRFYASYESCFNENMLNAIYSKYTQKPYNSIFQTRVGRPYFKDDNVYSRDFYVPVNDLFSPREQKQRITQLVGKKVDSYFSSVQELSRGHLAAKTDFVFAFSERATFHYVNCAPQWTGFNGGNWNSLEVDLRLHIHHEGYDTIIYTGTYGVSQLRNDAGRNVDVYLYNDRNNNPVIPVPKYFYKVVYEPHLNKGIAFVGINNPFYTPEEALSLFFCQDVCRNNRRYSWLTWEPDNPQAGYVFCCTVPDFQEVVKHIPSLHVDGLLS